MDPSASSLYSLEDSSSDELLFSSVNLRKNNSTINRYRRPILEIERSEEDIPILNSESKVSNCCTSGLFHLIWVGMLRQKRNVQNQIGKWRRRWFEQLFSSYAEI